MMATLSSMVTAFNSAVAAELRGLRAAMGLDQDEVAAFTTRYGVSESTLGRIERGVVKITVEHLDALGAVYGVSASHILEHAKRRQLRDGQ